MKTYKITLVGSTPLIMHKDNIAYSERLSVWRKAPENKTLTVAGDDRSPAWSWIGYLYEDGHRVCIDADNIMTMLREGGAKVRTGSGNTTFKKQTQSMLHLVGQQFELFSNGESIDYKKIRELEGNNDFAEHLATAERMGFELFVKRAKIGQKKHTRVRPRFNNWTATGGITVLDEAMSGITKVVLETILKQAGYLCGIGDWRPSSPSSGVFGKFTSIVEEA